MSELARRVLLKLFWNSVGQILVFAAIRKEKIESSSLSSVEEIVDYAMSYEFLGLRIKPLQIKEEFTRLLELMKELDPKFILEIGTCSGGSLFMISRMANRNAHIVSVDLPGGNFGAGYPPWKIPLFESFAREGQSISLIRGDSHSEETFQTAKLALRGNKLDLLFIDGDHTYDGVRKDLEMYSTLVRKGGVVALHDISDDRDPQAGVHLLWSEVKDRYDTVEIINDKEQGWAGIGIIRM
jgi:cephalosporin hydroxylase